MPLLETKQNTWTNIRTIATVDTTLAVTARKWSDINGSSTVWAKVYPVSELVNGIAFRYRFSSGDATTGVYEIWGIREDDDAEYVCGGNLTAGTQTSTMGTAGDTYADTITVTDYWNTTVKSTDATGHNNIAKLVLDGCGIKYWLVQLTTISAGTVYVDAVTY
jgi:hypothetical protein